MRGVVRVLESRSCSSSSLNRTLQSCSWTVQSTITNHIKLILPSKIDRSTNVMQTGATYEKVFSLGKDELQKYSGVGISANSFPRISLSSRSYLDDFEFLMILICPFDVDYDDMKNPGSRYL
ncbi:hypothetical protein TSUD_202150 [Trifolium subterraneum]|uniref:Uncharacterized protein n=1 Tax=Trifolium subterraneum TaxID=3900 RepID=A0A2Z6LPI5_TRISU|nr:hypothetical protein TSUD_202150 [Trifolium subterraneum]